MTNKDSSNKKLYNLIKTFMESWASAIAMDLILARSEEPKIDTPEYYAILYGAIDCCGQAVGADEETTMLTASVFFHYEDNIGGIEYFRKIFDTQNKPELRKWIVESGLAVPLLSCFLFTLLTLLSLLIARFVVDDSPFDDLDNICGRKKCSIANTAAIAA